MRRWVKLTAVATLMMLSAMAGCVKLRQVVTVMPDGSGKIDVRFGLSEQLIALAKETDEDPFKEVVPERMKDKAKGIVAFTEPTRQKQGNFTYLSYTMYFRDINKVHIEGLGEGKPAKYRFERDGESATLTLTDGTSLSIIADYKPTPESDRDDVAESMAGLTFNEHYILPGEVKPIDGVQTDANTAKIDLTLENLLDGSGPIQALQGKNTLRFEVPKVAVDDQVQAAFKNELEAAVAAWRAKQEQAE